MRGTPAAQAVRLTWLAPGAPALVALATADDPVSSPAVLADPAAVALVVRFADFSDQTRIELQSQRPALLRFARRQLRRPPAPAPCEAIRSACVRAGVLARQMANDRAPELADRAYVCGMLAGLGEMAAPGSGLELTRRLARRWRLPTWCAAVLRDLGHGIPLEGSDPVLLAIARSAVHLTQSRENVQLGAGPADDAVIAANAGEWADTLAVAPWMAPSSAELLPELLRTAERLYGRRRTDVLALLEDEVDLLHEAIRHSRTSEKQRLLANRLSAMAELAAGAGHEINTPLAIISGQAQLMLGAENDPERRKSLQTIVQQSRRVHDILSELMQFARPSRPNRQVLDVTLLIQESLSAVHELAVSRQIRLDRELPNGLLSFADPRQVRSVLVQLIRNAVDAAGQDGWVRVRGEQHGQCLYVVVEDSGAGPDPAIVEHLFDPFFSGRQAGRGRGLGLCTAWRLAREQGGEVRFAPVPGGPTRFELILPAADDFPGVKRLSA